MDIFNSLELIIIITLEVSLTKKYEQQRAKGLYGIKMIQHRGVKLWNELPFEIKNQSTLKRFTNLFKFYVTELGPNIV